MTIAEHLAHIKALATCMTFDNWRDMQDNILHQTEELSRLSVSPLPGETARLIERLHDPYHSREEALQAAAALERLAREIEVERAAASLQITQRDCAITGQQRIIDDLTKRRAAIKAKTIERCAGLAKSNAFFNGNIDAKAALNDLEAAIRALNQTEEKP